MKQQLEQAVAAIVQELFAVDVEIELTRTEPKFGDYATNVALQLSKQLGVAPHDIATKIVVRIADSLSEQVAEVQIAGPGFINLTLADMVLVGSASSVVPQLHAGQKYFLEYSCPNAFKELHTGHLYNTIVGDTLGRLLEASGAVVYRANFGGDVGLHVAKCLYGIQQQIGHDLTALNAIGEADRPGWISAAYVAGAKAYEADETAKLAIAALNGEVYRIHADDDHDSLLAQVYWTCRTWSYDYFKAFYQTIAVAPFDKYYPESATSEPGLAMVRAHIGDVFEESDGAVVYRGERDGLHTRVFITAKGLPTYEAKDLGVIFVEIGDFSYDQRIILTGNDQSQYMQVVFAALAAIDPKLAAKQTHMTNGTIRFGGGQKMSSRLGNVTRAVDVLQEVGAAVTSLDAATGQAITLGAIKYSFLKHRLGGDIAFDITDSVSLEGNSGPYLQYAFARVCSILRKAGCSDEQLAALLDPAAQDGPDASGFESGERLLIRKLSEYTEAVEKSITELLPHHICSYLYDLAQTFNRFYEHNRVLGDKRQATRLALLRCYARTLHGGLTLLGIPTPEKM